ncbi:MAG: hypothetical protein WAW96_11655 [Alphaproteobacteria bacterium]
MKPIIDHIRSFSTADVSVITVAPGLKRFVGDDVSSAAELTRLISKIIHRHLNRRVVSLPASDGYVFVVDNTADSALAALSAGSLGEAAAEVAEKLKEVAPAGSAPRVEVRYVGGIKQKAITHEEFIGLKLDQRHEQALKLMNDLGSSSILFLRNVPSAEVDAGSIYAFDAQRTVFDAADLPNHRDKRFETDPINLASDIQLMRKVCDQINRMFDLGDVVPQYCPLNFNTLKDSRYWPIYENELRNIATFFKPFIRWEIMNVPPGTPLSAISNVLERLRLITESVGLCQSGREALEKNGHPLTPSMPCAVSFYIPNLTRAHEEKSLLAAIVAYAAKHASRTHLVGLRNVPASAQVPLKLFEGSVFLEQNESRRLNLISSEVVELA